MDLPNIKISLINTEKDIEISHEYGMITDQTIDVYPEEVETAEVESQTEGVIGENIGPFIVGMLLEASLFLVMILVAIATTGLQNVPMLFLALAILILIHVPFLFLDPETINPSSAWMLAGAGLTCVFIAFALSIFAAKGEKLGIIDKIEKISMVILSCYGAASAVWAFVSEIKGIMEIIDMALFIANLAVGIIGIVFLFMRGIKKFLVKAFLSAVSMIFSFFGFWYLSLFQLARS